MSEELLEEEVARLRSELEAYRQQEMELIKFHLSAARKEAEHYKAEAERNAQLGRRIYNEMQLEISRLRDTISRQSVVRNRRRAKNAGTT